MRRSKGPEMKGVFFSVIILLLSLTLMGFTFLLFEFGIESSSDTLRMGTAERINDEIKAAENGFQKIVAKAVEITPAGKSVVFFESLPNGDANGLSGNINSFASFVSNKSSFDMKFNISLTDNTALRIKPSETVYTHPNGFGNNTILITDASAVTRYSLNITLNRTGATPVSWNTTNEDPDGVGFDIIVGGLTGTDFMDSKNLSRSSASRLSVKVPGGNLEIYVGGTDNSRLLIDNTNSIVAFVKTGVFFNRSSNYVAFNDQSINITATEYSISRVAAVRVS